MTDAPRHQQLVLWMAILGSFVAFLDGSVVNVALPAIKRDLGGGLSTQQWVVDGYLLALGTLILIAGSLSDLFGRKRIFITGIVGFGIASLLCAVAPTATFLVAARLVQGMAGALLVPSSLALIMSAFDGEAQAAAIGRWTAWTSVAFLIGPVLGGVLVDSLSWRLIFVINVLPVVAALLLALRLAGDATRPQARVDVAGAVTGVLALGGAVFALIEQGQVGWGDPMVLVALAVAVVAGAAFVAIERRSSAPMLPFSVFRAHDFWVGNLATFAIYAAFSMGPLVVGLYLQQVAGLTAALAGLALVPSTIVSVLLSGRFGAVAGRHGSRWLMGAGPLVTACGYLWMLSIASPLHYWWQVLPGVVLLGLGLSITVAPLTSAILGAIPESQAGLGSAVNNAVARIAGLVAVACLGLLTGERLDRTGLDRTLAVTAALLVAGGLIALAGIRDEAWRRAQAAKREA